MCPSALLFHPTHYSHGHFDRCSCFNVALFYCFHVFQHFSFGSQGKAGLSVSMYFFPLLHYSCRILSSVAFDAADAFDADCLSTVCSHLHCHVGILNAILDHASSKDLASLFGSDREDVFLELISIFISFGLIKCQSLPQLKFLKNTIEIFEHFKSVW